MWFSSGSCGLIVVLYQVAGVLPAQTYDRSWPFGDLRLKGLSLGVRTPMYPYVALRPTYRENSHADHTWRQHSHQTASFKVLEAPPVWTELPDIAGAPVRDDIAADINGWRARRTKHHETSVLIRCAHAPVRRLHVRWAVPRLPTKRRVNSL